MSKHPPSIRRIPGIPTFVGKIILVFALFILVVLVYGMVYYGVYQEDTKNFYYSPDILQKKYGEMEPTIKSRLKEEVRKNPGGRDTLHGVPPNFRMKRPTTHFGVDDDSLVSDNPRQLYRGLESLLRRKRFEWLKMLDSLRGRGYLTVGADTIRPNDTVALNLAFLK